MNKPRVTAWLMYVAHTRIAHRSFLALISSLVLGGGVARALWGG
jgi:hypothetical protein